MAAEISTLVILGPTAAGKSAFAIEQAQKLNGEIISADSMQVYRGMNIGTAKLAEKERQGIPHHLIDIRNPDEEWTVSDFVREAIRISGELAIRGKRSIIVGGTGLYLWAFLKGYSFPITPADKDLRAKLEKEDLPTLYAQLSTVDALSAKKIHPNDKKRIIRALEVFELTGKSISELQEQRTENTEHGARIIGLNPPREELYARIEQRVDDMIKKGLIEEVRGLLEKGCSRELNSMQALGYKETIEYLAGRWDKDKMIEELKKRTRNFAKRQMTWFRRFENVDWRTS
ncbi:tRNA (adenosine(37)-N6)-dimethylallyltransferase MiaA [Candidatus Saganbacteria bacterium]|nr:tRNA (adenosine(37)-N6)-dimethylallyltransferase MiaA [Candidatus Saganbacteria bacterium]